MTITASKQPEQMSVSELRGWLTNFGRKQKDRHHQNEVRRRSPIKVGRLSVRQRVLGFEKARDDTTTSENNSQQENNKPGIVTVETNSSYQENNSSPTNNKRGPPKKGRPRFRLPRIESGKMFAGKSANAATPVVETSFAEVPQNYDLPEAPSFQDSLCLTMSVLTTVSSTSSVDVETSGSVRNEVAFGSISDTHDTDTKVDSFPSFNSKTQNVLPQTWSDFEPLDFDDSSKTTDDSEKQEDPDDDNVADNWPAWNGDARQFLEQQALPSLQGYWSDREDDCGSEDGDTVATGLRTEPCGFQFGSGRITRKKNRYRQQPSFREPQQFQDFASSFTVFDAAKGSVPGSKPHSRTKSLADHLGENKGRTYRTSATMEAPPSPTDQSFHSANLFQDKTMTASTLDAICKEGKGSSGSAYQRNHSLNNFFERSGQASASSNSWSVDSGKPSVAPDAVDLNLSKHFNITEENEGMNDKGTEECRQPRDTASSKVDAREDLTVLASVKKDSWAPFPITTAAIKDGSPSKSDAISPASSFSSAIEKFGGGGPRQARKTRIQRQKEALEEQWAADRKPKHVKKTKWAVCRASGTYKKKVVLDIE